MRLSLGMHTAQVQTMKLAPRMIQSMEILQLPIMQLQERIEQELAENPLLELREEDPDLPDEPAEQQENPETPSVEDKELVVDEQHHNADDFERLVNLDQEIPDHFDDHTRVSASRMDEEADRKHDAMANIVDRPESLHDYLLHQLGELELEPDLAAMAERIISTLDPRDGGYLKTSLVDLLPASAGPEQAALAERALAVVQGLDPPGVAARDLKEGRLAQLTPKMLYYDELRTLI